MYPQPQLDRTFFALSAQARRQILARLGQRPARVKDLVEGLEISQQAVSKHVAVLRDAGLVRQERVGRERWCYAEAEPLEQARGWIELHEGIWNERLDLLERGIHAGASDRRS